MNQRTNDHDRRDDMSVWYCKGCKAVHLGVGDARISLDRARFSQFAEMVADVHYESFAGGGIFDILDRTEEITVESPRESVDN